MGILSQLHDAREREIYSVFHFNRSIPSITNRKRFKAKTDLRNQIRIIFFHDIKSLYIPIRIRWTFACL